MVRTTRVIELFHYRGPYHLGNNPLICFYMIGTSDMKELIWNCHTHTYGCKWGSNHNHDRQLITGSLLQPVDCTDYYFYIPSFSKYAGVYWPNKLLFLFSRIFFLLFFVFPVSLSRKIKLCIGNCQKLTYLKMKQKFTIIVDYFEFENILNWANAVRLIKTNCQKLNYKILLHIFEKRLPSVWIPASNEMELDKLELIGYLQCRAKNENGMSEASSYCLRSKGRKCNYFFVKFSIWYFFPKRNFLLWRCEECLYFL